MYSTDPTVKLPARQTKYSAGYDFYMPCDLEMKAGVWYDIDSKICFDGNEKIYTNVTYPDSKDSRPVYLDRWMMFLSPRSSLGDNYKFRLANTSGIIDQDYIDHTITAKVCVDEPLTLKKNEDRFMQGIILPVGYISGEPEPVKTRNGGHGSTDIISDITPESDEKTNTYDRIHEQSNDMLRLMLRMIDEAKAEQENDPMTRLMNEYQKTIGNTRIKSTENITISDIIRAILESEK